MAFFHRLSVQPSGIDAGITHAPGFSRLWASAWAFLRFPCGVLNPNTSKSSGESRSIPPKRSAGLFDPRRPPAGLLGPASELANNLSRLARRSSAVGVLGKSACGRGVGVEGRGRVGRGRRGRTGVTGTKVFHNGTNNHVSFSQKAIIDNLVSAYPRPQSPTSPASSSGGPEHPGAS